ncbi:MAG: hypothetical protein AB1552_10255 [Nitrospirota bacterium]
MKLRLLLLLCISCLLGSAGVHSVYPGEMTKEDCFYLSSLHYTTRGMAYWYDKKNGGLETLTGIPYTSDRLDCISCHVSSCDTCHKTGNGSAQAYSVKEARNQEICLRCHKREKTIMKIDKDLNQTDVHVIRQMQCMDCHTAREVHGDGTEYQSMKQQGALDARCGNCHQEVRKSTAHTVHGDKLDCTACHVRHVVSCTNCHIGTLVNERVRVDIKLSGWVYLMNYNGRVTSATMQTYVVPENRTFLMFAPQNSHSIMKDGRKCDDCHATEVVRQVLKGSLDLTWLENGELKHIKAVIPVAEGVTYNSVYQDYRDGRWIPIKNPPKPLLQYAGYGTPLSETQMKKLAMPMGK